MHVQTSLMIMALETVQERIRGLDSNFHATLMITQPVMISYSVDLMEANGCLQKLVSNN